MRPGAFPASCVRLLTLLLLAMCLLSLGTAARAHKPSDSYLTVRAEGNRIALRWDLALRDLDYVLQIDRDANGELTWGEVRQRSADIHRYAAERLQFATGSHPCPLSEAGAMQLDRHSDGVYAVLSFSADCESLAGALKLRYAAFFDVDPTHRGLVQWQPPGSGGASQALVFSSATREQDLQVAAPSAWETLRQYVWEGAWHIWIGFDHILFLLSLLLPAVLVWVPPAWRPAPSLRVAVVDVAKIVTAFTLAHSITLTLATLGVVSLPSALVESAIAASVVLAALNNLFPLFQGRRWTVAFVFGLIHGFGFATVLGELQLPQGALVLALLAFNVGVEIGQLAIVALFLPLAFALRASAFYRRGVLQGGSWVIAGLAAVWFVERAFSLELLKL